MRSPTLRVSSHLHLRPAAMEHGTYAARVRAPPYRYYAPDVHFRHPVCEANDRKSLPPLPPHKLGLSAAAVAIHNTEMREAMEGKTAP